MKSEDRERQHVGEEKTWIKEWDKAMEKSRGRMG